MIRNFTHFSFKERGIFILTLFLFSYSLVQANTTNNIENSSNSNLLMCPDYFSDTSVTLELGDELPLCAAVPYLDLNIHSFILDGSSYAPPFSPCAEETVIFYTYALLINQGSSGPYRVDSWVCANGQTHSATVQNMTELAALMQQWDPQGNWVHNPSTYTISGGNPANGYMNIEIEHIPTKVMATIMTNFTQIARGTEFTFLADTPGVFTLEIFGPDECQDKIEITVIDPCATHTANAGNDADICFDGFAQLSASGGETYQWSPAESLSDSNSANPIASPSSTTFYTVTVTNGIGCTATDQVRVLVNTPIEITVDRMSAANCCEGGNVDLNISGGSGDYTYIWSNGADNTTTGSDLAPGEYTVYVTDGKDCAGQLAFTIADECNCPSYFENDVVYTEPGEEVTACVPLLLEGSDIYDVIFDGSNYVGPMKPCSPNPIVFYTYALTINQGNAGPYRLDFWQCNDVIVENVDFQSMTQLAAIMNQYDPTGNWQNNPTNFTISGGNPNDINNYGDILITHIPTNVQASIMTNFTDIANGTELSVAPSTPGEYDLIVGNPATCCFDTLTVIVEPNCSDLSVSANVINANCCGVNGSVTLDVTGGYGGYSYKWDGDISHTGTASGLMLSSYRVTVTDMFGCAQETMVSIDSDCSNCVDLIDEEVIYAAPFEEVKVCLPILLEDAHLYDILVDGSDYSGPSKVCSLDSIIFYTYALTVNQGNDGPYRLDYWNCNDIVVENVQFETMADLAFIMNQYDPNGNWIHNPSTFTISGGSKEDIDSYGNILITHIETKVQATIMTNITDIPNGTKLTIAEEPGEHTLVVGNPVDCCYDTLTIIIEADCSDLSISADVVDANCCGVDGAVTLNVTGGYGGYNYEWQDDVSYTNTASGLTLDSYKVTVTDIYGCSQVGQININANCDNCEDVYPDDTVYFNVGDDAKVCVPVPFTEHTIYDIILDGSDYTQPTPCDIDSIIFYTYALTVNQGNSGPYRLDYWNCNEVVVENVIVQDMTELANLMNTFDPNGNWVNNPNTFTISGGADNEEYVYGNISITHIPTKVQATIQTNFTGVAFGTEIDVPDLPGTYVIELVNTEDCCSDIINIVVNDTVNPPTPGQDTIYYTTSINTPSINNCMPWQQFFDTGFASISLCDTPDNGTIENLNDGDACIDYIPNTGFVGMDEFCVEACNASGECGTIIVMITVQGIVNPPTPGQDTIYYTTSINTPSINNCMPWQQFFDTGFASISLCDTPDNGTIENLNDGDACIDYIPNTGFVGMDEFCVEACNASGECGTIIVMITVQGIVNPPTGNLRDTINISTPMNTTLANACMPWQQFFSGGVSNLSICDFPEKGTLTNIADSDECFDYIPNFGFTGMDELCVEVCNASGECGTIIVIITVEEPINPPVGLQDTLYLSTPFDTPIVDGCMPWHKFFDEGFASMTICDQADNGIVNLNTFDECLDYIPNAGFIGVDEFCVTICNDEGICGNLIVIITVGTPVTTPNTIEETIFQDTAIDLCLDITELAGSPVLFGSCGSASNGSVTPTLGMTECFTYQPELGFLGTDDFCVVICDESGLCDTTYVTINVIEFDGGGCLELLDAATLNIQDCNDGVASVCLPVSLEELTGLSITDNGEAYTGGFEGCDIDTMYTYLMITVPGQGSSGPYTVVSWLENGFLHENIGFNTLEDLVNLMNIWDPQGNWALNMESMTISGYAPNGLYSSLEIQQNSTGTNVTIDANIDMKPNATMMTFTEGSHTVVFTDALDCTDQILINIECPLPERDCNDIVSNESILTLSNDCNSRVSVCLDLPFSEVANIDINVNGEPYGISPLSCNGGTETQVSLLPGIYQLELVDGAKGCRDTVDLMISCLTTEIITDTIYVNTVDTVCLDITELPGNIVSVNNACTQNSGELVVFEMQPESYCVSYFGVEVGEENSCIVACDDIGFCDTTYIFVTVIEREAVPTLVIDVDTTFQDTPISINVLANDTLGVISSITIESQPENGSATITNQGIATYIPNVGFCNMQTGDSFTYSVCDDQGNCDTQQVIVYVICEDLQVYTGFSPNGDGINDAFYIEGLEAYPEAQVTIFNRWGNEVYRSYNYKNDWEGTWEDKILPDGTYFYVLDDGEGNLYSGYLQINR